MMSEEVFMNFGDGRKIKLNSFSGGNVLGKIKPNLAIVCSGSRDWSDKKFVESVLKAYTEKYNVTVIQGTSRGLDTIAGEVADELGAVNIGISAVQKTDFKRDLLLRNSVMLSQLEKYDRKLVLAFRNKLDSKGTNDTVYKAVSRRIPVIMYTLLRSTELSILTQGIEDTDLPFVDDPVISGI